jgi:hypothetical protein
MVLSRPRWVVIILLALLLGLYISGASRCWCCRSCDCLIITIIIIIIIIIHSLLHSSLAVFSKEYGLTDQALLFRWCAKNFLTGWHVLSITALCIRKYRAGWSYYCHYCYYYYWPTLLETVGLRVPNRNFTDFKLFHVNLNSRNCPSARCASATNAISRHTCIFSGRSVLINDLLLM